MRRRPRACQTAIPWRTPRRERLLLLLVAAASLTPIYTVSSQDVSRLCLSRSMVAGKVTIGSCGGRTFDHATFAGRTYSDKAPGMSALAIPAVVATRLPAANRWPTERNLRLWAIRVLTGGGAFLGLVFMFGRVSEGLSPGHGGRSLVLFALGTLVLSMAATTFGHDTAAAVGFGAFLSAWRKHWAIAGGLAGLAVLVEYPLVIVGVALAVYAVAHGARAAGRFVAGVIPAAALLAAYDRIAFGSPFHLSYRYVANRYAREQATGIFGIGPPRWHSVARVLFLDRGLLVTSPILVGAAIGLGLLARRQRPEAAVCVAVTVGFLLLEFGYFLPYGGTSPGPRFLIPALPFLALGLAPFAARHRRIVLLLAVPSLIAETMLQLTWSQSSTADQHRTVWIQLVHLLQGNTHHLGHELASNIVTYAGVSRAAAAAFVALCVAVALILSRPEHADLA